jgi:ubiquinone/menaquinone biosynthesis C-methylase UbiE
MGAHLFVASVYDALMVPADKLGFERVRQMVVKSARGRVLEIGAGTGLNFKHFDKAECVLAVEPDPYMISRAVPRLKNCAALTRATAEELPFPDSSFDTVVSTLTFCTIADPLKAAEEIRRVLKDDGCFFFAEHPVAEGRFLSGAERALTPFWRKVAGGCHLDRDIVSYFKSAGLNIAEIIRLDSFFVAGRASKGGPCTKPGFVR